MSNEATALAEAWKRWCSFVGSEGRDELRLVNEDDCKRIRLRLSRFSDGHQDTLDWISAVNSGLSKGKNLIEAAVRWDKPSAGPRANLERNYVDRARGEQWRLVMAHGGLETVMDALLPASHRFATYRDHAKYFLDRCGLTVLAERLVSPNKNLVAVAKWVDLELEGGKPAILTFLGLNSGDARCMRAWMVEGRSIETWPDVLQLAKALRNVTAHGALSPSKAIDWGLRPAFRTLGNNLGQVVTAALNRLTE